MPYLLDSDWLIAYLSLDSDTVRRVTDLSADGIAMSIVSYIELYEGYVRKVGRPLATATLEALASQIEVLHLSVGVAQRCGVLRATLREQGKRVNSRSLDLIIAATALEYGMTLATRNLHDFQDIADLQLLTA